MLISHKKKFIFIHIFKTAGTSITENFVPYARLIDKIAHQYYPTKKAINGINRLFGISGKGSQWATGFHKHASALEIKKKLNAEVFDTYFKFAFVRNPYDWLVSYYYYVQESAYHPEYKKIKGIGFEDFIPWYINQSPHTMSSFLVDEKGNTIVDYIGKLETLNNDIINISDKLNIPVKKISKRNVTHKRKDKNYNEYYTPKTLKLVNDYFKKDFELLGYDM